MDTPPAPAPDDGAEARRQRWQRLSAWLDEALDLPDDAARAAWRAALQAAPDEAAELDALLASHRQRDEAQALDGPPVLGARPAPGRAQPGQRVGPWRLHELLGQGGMAQVWRATRADGAYEREVALKLPLHLPWRDDLGKRLARERDLLARLNHPHIARLYDAGVDDGHPWMAMERVDGRPLTAWCDAQRAGPRQRVQLFLQVLDAVSHAHGQLVLHRDLKPSNILVDGQGQVKLLDFGIAKLLGEDDRLTHDTRLTAFGGRALTLDYASPEQLRGEPLGAASDVYALGVLLHELLCGELPYRLPRRSAAQLETAILQDLPTRPSSRPGPEQSAHRGLTPRRLSRQLRGDLDAITLTALRKDPAQRYASAAELRADLQRWLDDEPVRARPDAWSYRARVFLRRHRAGVALGAVVSAALLASTVFSWQQARLAEREALRARATRDFLLGLYKPVSWLSAQPLRGGQVTARELLDLSAEQLQRAPVADPLVQQDLFGALIDLYGDVDDTRGQLDAAKALLSHARAHFPGQTPQHFEALVRLSLAEHAVDRGAALQTLTRADAMPAARAAARPDLQARYWLSRGNLLEGHDTGAAEAAFQQAIEVSDPLPELALYGSRGRIGLARIRHFDQSRLQDAVVLYADALSRLRAMRDLPVYALTKPEVELAELLARLGRVEEAESLLVPAYQRNLEGLGPTYRDTVQTGLRLARLWRVTGRTPQAAALLQDLERAHQATPALRQDVATLPALRRERADVEGRLGLWAQAATRMREALTGLRQRQAGQASALEAQWLLLLAVLEAQAGQPGAAREAWVQALRLGARVQRSPLLERDQVAAQAQLTALGVDTEPAPPLPRQALFDEWRRQEARLSQEASPEHQARQQARVLLWQSQAELDAGQVPAAMASAGQALTLLVPWSVPGHRGTEQVEGWALQAEATARLGQGPQACALARQAAPGLLERLPGSPAQQITGAVLTWCATPPGRWRPDPAPWPEGTPAARRWQALRALSGQDPSR